MFLRVDDPSRQSFAAFRIEQAIFDFRFEAEPGRFNNGCRQRLA
jgi:hypothetical protein